MKIVSVVGARPQFVKIAPTSRALRRTHEEFLVHTGQHYDTNMSDVFFSELSLPAIDFHLGVGSGSAIEQIAKIALAVEPLLKQLCPDWVIVYGDTNSTIGAALAARKCGVRLAHVESGCRSYNREMPEEQNRILTDHISDLLLCATNRCAENLSREGLIRGVHVTGDVMLDALRYYHPLVRNMDEILAKYQLQSGNYALLTVHRASNTESDASLRAIFSALESWGGTTFFPVHPRVQSLFAQHNIAIPKNVLLSSPVGYLDMLALEVGSSVILTDSGGVQREAFFLEKPCITLREETEWVETIEAGGNVLTGVDPENLLQALKASRQMKVTYDRSFGDGQAAMEIVHCLESFSGAS